MKPSHALTIRQPWAWAIVQAGKRVENRTWFTQYRGPIYVHASGNLANVYARDELRRKLKRLGLPMPDVATLTRGALIATAELVDVTRTCPKGQKVWADRGAVYFVLANVRALRRPTPMRGTLGIWRVDGAGKRSARVRRAKK